MRLKSRWYVCQLEFGSIPDGSSGLEHVSTTDVFNAVRATVQECFGDVGLARIQAYFAVKYFSAVTNLCLIRGPADYDKEVHAAIALTRMVKKRQAAVRVLQVCCAPRTLKPAAQQWHTALTGRMAASSASDAVALDAAFLDALNSELIEALERY